MNKVGYVSIDMTFAPQEQLMVEGNVLNIHHDDKKSHKDSLGLKWKYPKQFKTFNGGFKEIERMIESSDFLICDYSHPRNKINKVRELCEKHGKVITGANHDKYVELEEDRHYAKKFASDVLDMNTVPSIHLTTRNDFIEYTKSSPYRIVVKARDQKKAKVSTYIPLSNDDAIEMAKKDSLNMFKSGGVVVEPFYNGYEICFGGYFNGNDFNDTILVNQEYKGVCDGDVGNILTGEVGTVMYWEHLSKLPEKIKEILLRLQKYLSEESIKYRGFIDINTMIVGSEIYLLEFTIRHGQPTESEVLNMICNYTDLLKWQVNLSDGRNIGYDFNTLYVQGCLFTYGTPYKLHDYMDFDKVNSIIYGISNLRVPARPVYAFYDKNDGLLKYNFGDRILIVHGKGMSISGARVMYEEEIKKVSAWHAIYRTDIGYRWKNLEEVAGDL